MNTEQARFNMIEQQIRPWNVLDVNVLELLSVVKRENFVPETYRNLAFADFEIPLHDGERMLAPKIEARIMQELALKGTESVLEIGSGSGYMAALLGARAKQVLSVEINTTLANMARHNLRANQVLNVEVVEGDAARGWEAGAPYDVIAVSGGLPSLPQTMLEQLTIGGRLSAFVGEAPVMEAQLVTRLSESEYRVVDLFETFVAHLKNALAPARFTF